MANAQHSPDMADHIKTYRNFVFAIRLIVGGTALLLLLLAILLV